MSDFKKLLILPRINIQNANALSSPFTIGFPAVPAWMGAVHALQRKLNQQGYTDAQFNGVGVVSHEFNLQTYQGESDFVASIIGTGNPLDKEGNRPSFIEEARCHLTVSLIIDYEGIDIDDKNAALELVKHILHGQLKMAGGDILSYGTPYFTNTESSQETQKILRRLMPGYVLLERRELMKNAMEQGQDALDAMLDYLSIHHNCSQDGDKVEWSSTRKEKAWLVPIATGFQGISSLGNALNQRDETTPHRFAESIITLGEFKMLHRIEQISEILWQYQYDQSTALYSCVISKPEANANFFNFMSNL